MASVEEAVSADNNDIAMDNLIMSPVADKEKVAPEEVAAGSPAAVITPCKTAPITTTSNSTSDDGDTGDTVSETSVASESQSAFDSPPEKEKEMATETPIMDAEAPVTVAPHANSPVLDAEDSKVPAATTTTATTTTTTPDSPSANKENDAAAATTVAPGDVATTIPTPPRKVNRVSLTVATLLSPTTTTTTPSSPRRTNTAGLSELSKQLRVLQAKNQYLQSEMERCQRQLKIISDLKGVSVVDVLASLENACANEASAELQSQITSLKAQLEALQMSSSSNSPKHEEGGRAAALKHESLKQQIAALELQVGAAEEMEVKLQAEIKSLYSKVSMHQTTALTLEATGTLKTTLLQAEQSKNAELQAEIVALKQERDVLKDKEQKRMAQKWQETLQQSASDIDSDPRNLLEKVEPYQPTGIPGDAIQSTTATDFSASNLPKDNVSAAAAMLESSGDNSQSTPKPSLFAPFKLTKDRRSTLRRTFSDPAIRGSDLDGKVANGYVSSILPRYSSTHKQWQWNYDVADDTHRSNMYVKQSAKNMELEALCRHQQQSLHDLQNDQNRDEAKWQRLELERNAAHTKRNAFEQQVSQLELDLRLEAEKAESLQGQLDRREEEHSLKKEQLQSQLQQHQVRIQDVEGQLSSLYVAFELLQEDRSVEHTQQALMRTRLVDADSKVAHMSSARGGPAGPGPASLGQIDDVSETGSTAAASTSEGSAITGLTLRQRAGLLTPSPKRNNSVRNLFSRSPSASSAGLPLGPPLTGSSRRSSATPPGLPPTPSSAVSRRSSTGSAKSSGPPPPGTTICKGYLLMQQSKKKKLLRGESPPQWKKKYMVLKCGEGSTGARSYSLWYGDVPQGKVKGNVPHLIRGISTVTFSGSFGDDATNKAEVDMQPHSFTLYVNPRDPAAPIIQLAAYSSHELQPWKSILEREDGLGVRYYDMPEADQQRADSQMAGAIAKKYAL